jgi:PAS domain S-box-containing protein
MECSNVLTLKKPLGLNGPGAPPDDIIRIRAYQKWEQRGCPAHGQQQDWFDAEGECLLERHLSEADPSLLRSILTNTTAVIYVKDLEGRYLLINRRFEALFKVRLKWILGRSDYDLFPPDLADTFRANDMEVLSEGKPIEFEEQVTQDDGLHTYISHKFPIRNRCGELYAVCGMSTDITERHRLMRRRATEHAVTQALAEASNLGAAAAPILQALCEALALDLGALWSVDGQVLRCVGVWSNPDVAAVEFERITQNLTCAPGVGLPGRAWTECIPVVLDTACEAGLQRQEAARRARVRFALAVPILEADAVTGVLEFYGRNTPALDADLKGMLDALGRQIGLFMQRKRAEAALRERTMELQLAHRIQQGFFPKKLPQRADLDLAAESQAAQETGGDYVDFVPMADPLVGIAVGDVSGHGVGSALLMALTRAYVRAFALSHREPSEFFPRLNRSVAGDIDPDHFVTLFFATLDPVAGSLTYANAGHLPGYVIARDGRLRYTLTSTCYPLGLDADGEFPAGEEIALVSGDLLFIMTDGISEAFGPRGQQYGLARAVEFVRAHRKESCRLILDELFREVRTFSAGQPQFDDRSALLVKWRA